MTASIWNILGSLIGFVGTWYLSKTIAKWLRGVHEKQNRDAAERARIEAQRDNQRANQEGDVLRDIDRGD